MHGQVIARPFLVIFLASMLAATPARAEQAPAPRASLGVPALRMDPALLRPRASARFQVALQQSPPNHNQPVEPVHAVTAGPVTAGEPLALTQKWWFWAAAGLLLVTTTVLLVVATREPDAPRTRLGNMEAFR